MEGDRGTFYLSYQILSALFLVIRGADYGNHFAGTLLKMKIHFYFFFSLHPEQAKVKGIFDISFRIVNFLSENF